MKPPDSGLKMVINVDNLFVNLWVYSFYSLMTGVSSPRALAQRAQELGATSLALTDRGNLHGAVEFARACHEYGIKPIFGLEVNVDDEPILLFAETNEGYRQLCRIASESSLTGASSLTPQLIEQYRDGLIAVVGLQPSRSAQTVSSGTDLIRENALWLDIFDSHRLYFNYHVGLQEVPNTHTAEHDTMAVDFPFVYISPVYYARESDAITKKLVDAIRRGERISPKAIIDHTSSGHDCLGLPSSIKKRALSQNRGAWQDNATLQRAVENTRVIADRCRVDLFSTQVAIPKYQWKRAGNGDNPDNAPGSELYRGSTDGSSMDLLRRRVKQGIVERYGDATLPEVNGRTEKELSVIEETGFEDYFLIVADIVAFAKRKGIPVGPGRGSAASSIVAFALGITDVDPLRFGLLFERFLNPERVTMPDIDIDFCYVRRQEVLDYVRDTYGNDRVAHICTFGTFSAKSATIELNRVFGEADGLLEDAAERLSGIPRYISTHAAGIVVTDEPLAQTVPMCRASDGTIMSQYKGEDLEQLGLLKIDLLGLRTLTVIDETVKLIAANRGVTVDTSAFPPDDAKVYTMLGKGQSEGVFQLETAMFQKLLREIKPKTFEHIIAMLALGRPGAMSWNERHRVDPLFKEMFPETEGLMLYQEQVMILAHRIAGYSLGEADVLRRAMAKKQPDLMTAEANRFIEASVRRGLDRRRAQKVFSEVSRFAGYGFAKSHAAAYAILTYQTAYLKAHYPAEFMTALLNSVIDVPERINRYTAEAKRLGITVEKPDINGSDVHFTVHHREQDAEKASGYVIKTGLASVPHIGRKVAETIVAGRNEGPYRSLQDLIERVPDRLLHANALARLAQSGAFDALYDDPNKLQEEVQALGKAGQSGHLSAPGQTDLLTSLFDEEPEPLRLHVSSEEELESIVNSVRKSPGNRPVVITLEGKTQIAELRLPRQMWVSEDVKPEDMIKSSGSPGKE